MGAGVSKKSPKANSNEPGDGAQRKLPKRGVLRVLGFQRNAVLLPHVGSWLEVTVMEAKDLPAADDNGLALLFIS